MRIAYLHYLSSDDSALVHVHEFVRAARALGSDVRLCPLNASAQAPEFLDQPRGAPDARRPVRRWLARYLHEPKELLLNLRYLRDENRILRNHQPTVILARSRFLTVSHVVSAWRRGLPLVLEVNAPVLESALYKDAYVHLPFVPTMLERWQLAAADAVVVVSSTLKSFLLDRYDVPETKIRVVPNGADVHRFRPDVDPDPRCDVLRGVGPVVGFVGSFQEMHGIDLLGRLITRVGELRPDTRFLLVGEGRQAAAAREMVGHLGERVLFTGRIPHDRVPGFVAAFDIGVLPETGFYCSPLKLVEWMAAGRAIVAPRYGSVTDLVSDDVDALLFPPRDEDAFLAAVLRLIDDAALRKRLGEAARRRTITELTWTENARAIVDACRTVAATRHGS